MFCIAVSPVYVMSRARSTWRSIHHGVRTYRMLKEITQNVVVVRDQAMVEAGSNPSLSGPMSHRVDGVGTLRPFSVAFQFRALASEFFLDIVLYAMPRLNCACTVLRSTH